MSTIEAKIVKVDVLSHPNADKLEIARIGGEGGFESIVGLGQFATGDLALYIPVGSIVPENIQEHLAKNKISIKDGRIRCAKIRGIFSEGLCLTPSEWLPDKEIKDGNDVTKLLGITKYEPPPPGTGNILGVKYGININYENRNFIEYTCVEKFKKYPDVLQGGEEVVATIKWHGTNFRCGLVKKEPKDKTLWEKFKGIFVKDNPFEFLTGSHARIRKPTPASLKTGDYLNDTYWRAVDKYNLISVIEQIQENESLDKEEFELPEVTMYAEIVGPGIQKGYTYGIDQSTIEIRVFDIMVNKKFLKWDRIEHLCDCFDLPTVQEAYRGPWSLSVVEYAKAIDEYGDKKYNREGIVIRPTTERWDPKCGRVILKYLNPVYELDKNNSENH